MENELNVFDTYVKSYLEAINCADRFEKKMDILVETLDYIIVHKNLFDQKDQETRGNLLVRLLDLQKNSNELVITDKYIKSLFSGDQVGQLIINHMNFSTSTSGAETFDVLHLSNLVPIKIEQVPKIDEQIKTNDSNFRSDTLKLIDNTVSSLKLKSFEDEISIYLFMIEKIKDPIKQVNILNSMFGYIISHRDIFEMDEYKGNRFALLLKLKELKNDSNKLDNFNPNKYIQLLFPEEQVEMENIYQESEENLLDLSLDNDSDIDHDIDLVGIYLGLKQSKIITNLVFDDFALNKFYQKSYNLDLVDSILQDLSSKYDNVDKLVLQCMLNNNKTIEQIHNDTTYANGPFIVKLNDSMYELYEKTTTICNSGYIYGTLYSRTYENATVKKIGKYGNI